ncbi:methylmalonyl Co-A mutase-associated GTPase MeaB [Cytobacillus firmus]|uniref:methylmalonyl Co-A mutase-associated GTPase MeaB n=1 Tax=Cytobacillus TaxID=2675230 RepID=UPI001D1520C4|nr:MULTISPECIES: methylmalonyl Co-A mutase-associated GTPase MeaB [Cytobacillus]MCC3647755.1 methylmalonyl Co-A mutase-associated GTPase MeaB [Cytobacillus oceanisediminis]USK37844.1 methylmalonyl Co-A mutase-associated GTPase MeaB [Cytobacillus firmus]
MTEDKKPEWFEEEKAEDFTSTVRSGVDSGEPKQKFEKIGRFQKKSASLPDLDVLEEGILSGSRTVLARAITLIESNAEHHFRHAQELLHRLLPHSGRSLRIGITGVPGAGKSTFIESFGTYLCDAGLKVAVLAVDPSSSLSGGSILGDKTRMEQLSRNPRAFIRPSPSAGKLGGVHRKTRETMLLCEAAGFDVILVETVGVGQSEVIVREMVDFFMLLTLTGAGDELQGMKKGIMELADAVIVNKADGSNKKLAEKTKAEYNRILHFLQPATKGWQTKAYTCSSVFHEGISEIWNVIKTFENTAKTSGVFEERRRIQTKQWIHSMILDQLQFSFFYHPDIKPLLPKIENEVIAGNRTVTSAVEELFNVYTKR